MKSSIGLFYQLTVTDKNGKVVRKTGLRRSKSFCLAFLRILWVELMVSATQTVKDILGASETISSTYSAMLASNATAGDVSMGISVGTGTTPVDNADYVMETQIADGAGAGQLEYASQTFIEAQEVGANVDLQAIRSMQNLSGSPINITEAGFQCTISTGKKALLLHDVFTAVPVANGQTITITYTLRTTV